MSGELDRDWDEEFEGQPIPRRRPEELEAPERGTPEGPFYRPARSGLRRGRHRFN